MKNLVRYCLGCITFFYAVYNPVYSSIVTSISIHYGLVGPSQFAMLYDALEHDPCNEDVLNLFGDGYFKLNIPIMAAIEYGTAVNCSPGNAWMRLKIGEALIMSGFKDIGFSYLGEASKLEPNNPFFKSEAIRLKALLSQ